MAPPPPPPTTTLAVPDPQNLQQLGMEAEGGNGDEEGVEDEVADQIDRVIITGENGEYLEGVDLSTALEGTMELVEHDQDRGQRLLSFEEWRRTRGHLSVIPTDGYDGTSARGSGEGLISLANGFRVRLANGTTLPLRARWSSQLPRVSQWSVRY